MDRLTITFSGMLLIWVLLIVWANWEWSDRKKLVYLSVSLFLVWSVDRLAREINRPASEILIFSGEKGILLDVKVGERFYTWNENFPPEQISFSIDLNRVAEQRPLMPETLHAVVNGRLSWFPLLDFQFDAGTKTFLWASERPARIEQISPNGSWELTPSDSLVANNGTFRVVF